MSILERKINFHTFLETIIKCIRDQEEKLRELNVLKYYKRRVSSIIRYAEKQRKNDVKIQQIGS